MTVAFAVIFLALALAVRAGRESIRSSSRIHIRHSLEDGTLPPDSAAEIYLDEPGYFTTLAAAWEVAFATCGSALLAFGAMRAGTAGAVGVTVLVAALYAVLAALAGGTARALEERSLRALLPLLSPLIKVAGRLVPVDSNGGGNGRDVGDPAADTDRETVDELLQEGVREGIGDTEDMKIVSRVIQLRDRPVSEVMIPREEVFALSAQLEHADIARRIAAAGYSRVPIFAGDLDSILGIYHALDLLKSGVSDLPPMRSVIRAEETESCSDLLIRLLKQNVHLCVVTSLMGRTVGIVTLEDLLEEIVGEIRDEYDEPAASPAARTR